jgi:hypothetical protein
VRREREMVRSIGGVTETERKIRDAAVGGSEIRATRTGEAVASSWKSGAAGIGAGAAGTGGTLAVSQSQRRQWQPGESLGVEGVGGFPCRSPEVLSPQQEPLVVLPGGVKQQDRFLAFGWQQDFEAGVVGFARSPTGAAF